LRINSSIVAIAHLVVASLVQVFMSRASQSAVHSIIFDIGTLVGELP